MQRRSTSGMQPQVFRIDKRDLEAKVNAIQESLRPLIEKLVTPDLNYKRPVGMARDGQQLVRTLSESVEEFLNVCRQLTVDYADVKDDLEPEISRVREVADQTIKASSDFVAEASSSQRRTNMQSNARKLLNSVARMLALADMIDAYILVTRLIETMKQLLVKMKAAKTNEQFMEHFKVYGQHLKELLNFTSKAIQGIGDATARNELSSSMGFITKQSLFLYTTSKAFIQHPQLVHAQMLHDKVYKETTEALARIQQIFMNSIKGGGDRVSIELKHTSVDLTEKLEDLEKQVGGLSPVDHNEIKNRAKLETQLNEIMKHLEPYTSKDLLDTKRNNRIVDECSALQKALQDLFNAYSDNKNKMNAKTVEKNQSEFIKKNRSIRRQLRKAIIDQFAVLTSTSPIDELIAVAKTSNNQAEFDDKVAHFRSYAGKLVELSQLACSMSKNKEGIRLVQMVKKNLESLVPYVLNAAQIQFSFKTSKEAAQNLHAIRQRWMEQLNLLQLAIDDITSINDFLAVYEYKIYHSLNRCILALANLNVIELNSNANQVVRETLRVCDVVHAEMNNYEPCEFTNKIDESVRVLRDKLLIGFSKSVDYSTDALNSKPLRDPNENELIECSRLINDAVRDLRNAILLIPQEDSSESYLDYEDMTESDTIHLETVKKEEHGFEESNDDEAAMNDLDDQQQSSLTQEQKDKLNEELSSLRKEKFNFDREVLKWDDKSNDIILLSKQMCVIMMDMIKFTRGVGPYKTTMDIIPAAKKINEIGLKLEKLCRNLANECPESQSKKELVNYLNALPLFCNQLSIGTKVQENIIVDLENGATSLIISSKNLMNTVISVVKSSYVASTKYASKTDNKKPIVQWKMRPPELKPLVNKPRETADLIRKASKKNTFTPIKTLSEFQI